MNWLVVFSNNVIMSTLAPMLDTATCFRLSIQVSKALAGVIFWPGKQEWEAIFQWKYRIVDMFYRNMNCTEDKMFQKFQDEIIANVFYKEHLKDSNKCITKPLGAYLCLGGCGCHFLPQHFVARRFCKYNCCVGCYMKTNTTEMMVAKIGGVLFVQSAFNYHLQKVIEQVRSSVFGIAVANLDAEAQGRFDVFLNRQTEGNRFMTFYEGGVFGMHRKYPGSGFIEKQVTLMGEASNPDFVFFSNKYIEGCIEYCVQKILWLLKTDFCKIVFNANREDPPQLDEILGFKRRKLG